MKSDSGCIPLALTQQFPYKAIAWIVFVLSVAVFIIYHVSHGFPGPGIGLSPP